MRTTIIDGPEVKRTRGRVGRRASNGGKKKGHGEVLEGPQKSKGQSLVKSGRQNIPKDPWRIEFSQ